MDVTASEARELLSGREIWIWYYLHADWQWTQSRHWHEDRYALAVTEALDIMQRDAEFSFYFDTTSEFYGAVEQRLGSRLDELKQRVREGRVRIVSGQVSNCRPTQVGDETYVRNLQLGRAYFDEHLPPTDLSLFHACDIAIGGVQMPQLLNLAGFRYYRACRPHGPMNVLGVPHQFTWQGIDGSRILVTRGTYGGIPGPNSPPVHFEDDWDAAVTWLYDNQFHDQLISGRSLSGHLYVTQGMDDARPQTAYPGDHPFDVLGLVEAWRRREDVPIRWCTPLEYSQAVATRQNQLPVVEGILDGADAAYNMANHGSYGLWRWRQMNDRRLVQAERWAAAAGSAGFVCPHPRFRELWYEHCIYQAHAQDFAFDDDWHDLINRARSVAHRAERIQENAVAAIVRAAGGGRRFTRYVLNPHPWSWEADVEIYHPCATAGIESLSIVDENGAPLPQQQLAEFRHPRYGGSLNDEYRLVRLVLPPLGYQRLEIVESARPVPTKPSAPADGVLQTSHLRLVYRDHALCEIHDLAAGHAYASRDGSPWPGLAFHVLDNQNWVLGGPELRRDTFVAQSSEWLQCGPLRHHHRSRGTLGPYDAWLDTVAAAEKREIEVAVRLDGHWLEPPVTGFATLLASVGAGGAMTVDTPFAVEARDPDQDLYVDNVPASKDYGMAEMFERLRPGVFWGRSWCDWSGQGHGVTLISADGCYYWLKEPHQFGHILLRSIARREGTWEEFLPRTLSGAGTHHFRYKLMFHDGDWRLVAPQRRSLELRHPPLVARANFPTDARLPRDRHSFLRLEGPALLSAYYEDGCDTYVRMYESAGRGGDVVATFDWSPGRAELVDLLGQPTGGKAAINGDEVQVSLRPWQIATLKLGRHRGA